MGLMAVELENGLTEGCEGLGCMKRASKLTPGPLRTPQHRIRWCEDESHVDLLHLLRKVKGWMVQGGAGCSGGDRVQAGLKFAWWVPAGSEVDRVWRRPTPSQIGNYHQRASATSGARLACHNPVSLVPQ